MTVPPTPHRGRQSRRRLLGLAGGGGVVLVSAALGGEAPGCAAQPPVARPIEPRAGAWKTWVLRSGSELRLPPPPDAAATGLELDELRALAAARDGAALDRVRFWDAGAPGYRWNELMLAATTRAGVVASRPAALLNVAIYDATIAAWDSKFAHNRSRPAAVDPALDTALTTPASPSYPCEHAAAAGAAATVLSELIPDDAQTFAARAEEAAQSRAAAGVAFPSDVRAGLELGRAVAERVIERARSDGSSAPWTGTVPDAPGQWSLGGYPAGTMPALPTAGTWQTWVLTAGNQFRPGPPPAAGSDQLSAELAEIKDVPRTFQSNQAAFFWHPFALTRWLAILNQKLFEERLDENPPRAARAYALASIGEFDALVAVFDAKYTYWQIRPFQLDPAVTTLFPTPNHPSYPAAHGTLDGAWEGVLSYLFPRDAAYFTARAEEAANSRVWGGIHYRSDIETGLALGRQVSQAVVERADADGSR